MQGANLGASALCCGIIDVGDNDLVQVKRVAEPVATQRAEEREGRPKDILSRARRKLMLVLSNPDFANATVREICEAAGVSKATYFKAMRDPEFHKEHNNWIRSTITNRLYKILDSAIQTATTVGRDGFQDRRLLFEMAGHYNPHQELHIQAELSRKIDSGIVDPSALEAATELAKKLSNQPILIENNAST